MATRQAAQLAKLAAAAASAAAAAAASADSADSEDSADEDGARSSGGGSDGDSDGDGDGAVAGASDGSGGGGGGGGGGVGGLCVVCLEQPALFACVPCGHRCGCMACLEGIRASSRKECPLCRAFITATLRVYEAGASP